MTSSALDTFLFFGIAFSAALNPLLGADAAAWAQGPAPLLGTGPEAPLWVSLALADLGIKLLLTLVTLLPFRLLTRSWRTA